MLEALILTVIAVWLWYYLFRRHPRLSHLPGPRGWPVLGNTLQVDPLKPHVTMAEWARQHGEVYVLRFINENWVFLNTCETIGEMLVKRSSEYAGRALTYRLDMYSDFGHGIAHSHLVSDDWKRMKLEAHKGIKMYTSEGKTRVESLLTELIDDMLAKLSAYGGREVDFRDDLYNIMTKSILVLVVGMKVEDGDPLFAMIKEMDILQVRNMHISGRGAMLDLCSWLRFFGNRAYEDLRKAQELMGSIWNTVYPNLQERFENKERSCVIHNMMEAFSIKPPTDKAFDYERNLRQAARDLIGGGTVTTVASLYALFNILLHYPAVKAKLQQEIDNEIGHSTRCTLADRVHMPYTHATLLELQRYVSFVPLGDAHVAMTSSSIKDYKIPQGTNVVTNAWYVQHDETLWKDPWEFQPERFLDKDTGNIVPPDHENRKQLVAIFGAGIRACPGEALAMARIFFILTSILQRFDVTKGDVLVSCDPRGYELGIVLSPPSYKLKFLRRW